MAVSFQNRHSGARAFSGTHHPLFDDASKAISVDNSQVI
jgi:hypothetical protein